MAAGGLAAVGVVAAVGVEAGGRAVLQSEVADRLGEVGTTGDVDVVVGRSWWRPSVWPALVTGDVDRVRVRVRDGELVGLPVRDADYVLDRIGGDLSLRDRSVSVESLGEGSVRLLVDPRVLGEQLGVELSIRDGRLVDGEGTPVRAEVVDDRLVFSGEGLSDTDDASVTVVDPYLLPCRPDVAVVDEGLQLACTGEELPGVLRAPLAGPDRAPPADAVEDLPPPQTLERPGG